LARWAAKTNGGVGMTPSEAIAYSKHECGRCGAIRPTNELKIVKRKVPIRQTSGTSISSWGGTGHRNTYVSGSTDYEIRHVYICRKCPRTAARGSGLFGAIVKFVLWTVIGVVALFALLVILTLVTHPKSPDSAAEPNSSSPALQPSSEVAPPPLATATPTRDPPSQASPLETAAPASTPAPSTPSPPANANADGGASNETTPF